MGKKKKVEAKIRECINIKSRDFLDELLAYKIPEDEPIPNDEEMPIFQENYNKSKWLSKGIISVCSICLLCFITFGSYKMLKNKPSIMLDNVNFNKIAYNVGEGDKFIDSNDKTIQIKKDLSYINFVFDLSLDKNIFEYSSNILCYATKNTEELSFCSINLVDNNNILKGQIRLKKSIYPLFSGEHEDMWNQQEQFDSFNKSTLNQQKIILIENNTYNFKNYKTKFKINDVGISIDGIDIDQEEFIDIVKTVINSF